jgi:hypothetical protein
VTKKKVPGDEPDEEGDIRQAIANENKRRGAMLQRHTWKIWGFVRDNKDSLDSERACEHIRAGFDAAVESEKARTAELSTRAVKLTHENQRLTKQLEKLQPPKPKEKAKDKE